MVVRTLDTLHDLLVVRVPPKHFATKQAKQEHAAEQATYRDDERDRFAPGLRVSDEFMSLLPPHLWEELGKDYLGGGHPMHLVEVPETYRRDTYRSYEQHQQMSREDLERQVAAGFVEKLNYCPRVINAQGGVYVPEKDKYRPVMDATKSGLNGCLQQKECRYDMLRDLLRVLQKDDKQKQSAFDLKDAFYMWPRQQVYCNYQGLRGPASAPGVYRYRYLPMGVSDCPGYQQQWAGAIKWVVNEQVLLPLCKEQLLENGMSQEEVGVQSRAEIAAMYMDDGKVRHPACFTLEQANRQFEAVLGFLDKHGIQYYVKKSVWPDEVGSYVGVQLDTTGAVQGRGATS